MKPKILKELKELAKKHKIKLSYTKNGKKYWKTEKMLLRQLASKQKKSRNAGHAYSSNVLETYQQNIANIVATMEEKKNTYEFIKKMVDKCGCSLEQMENSKEPMFNINIGSVNEPLPQMSWLVKMSPKNPKKTEWEIKFANLNGPNYLCSDSGCDFFMFEEDRNELEEDLNTECVCEK